MLDARNVVTYNQARTPASRNLSRTSGWERKNRRGIFFSREGSKDVTGYGDGIGHMDSQMLSGTLPGGDRVVSAK